MVPTRFSCGAVVYRQLPDCSQVLLVKQFADDTAWGIPKGHMEDGETYTETAIRETKEEAGIDIKIITQLPHVVVSRRNYKKVVVPFLAVQTCDREPSSTSEASEVSDVRWFDTLHMPPIYYYQRPILEAALLMLEMNGHGRR